MVYNENDFDKDGQPVLDQDLQPGYDEDCYPLTVKEKLRIAAIIVAAQAIVASIIYLIIH